MSATIYAVVMSGPFAGFTAAEMQTQFARYKEQLQAAGTRLAGASVNGSSYQFGPRSGMSLNEWGIQIRRALAQVSPDFIAPQSSIAIRFGCS